MVNINNELKKEYWDTFSRCITKQFENDIIKYKIGDKELTDLVCELSLGKTGVDWIIQTIVKYAGRYLALEKESDLFKIVTYAYIIWLKKEYWKGENNG